MRLLFAAFGVWIAVTASGGRVLAAQDSRSDSVRPLLARLERIAAQSNINGFMAVLSDSADRARAEAFATSEFAPGATRVVAQERDRTALPGTLPGDGYQLIVDVMQEFGARARVATWRLDIKRLGDPGTEAEWLISDEERVSTIENLYKLSLDPRKQFRAHDLTVIQDDLELTLSDGSVFVSDTDRGTTSAVLSGRGVVRFHPAPDTERTQVKIFSGAETLDTSFDLALIKISPDDFEQLIARSRLTEVPVDAREFRRADKMFRDEAPKSYGIDFGELSPDTWSLLPSRGDFIAEIKTRRFDMLTYARSSSEPEDLRLFQRARRKTIAQYSSPEKLQQSLPDSQGRGDFGVRHYNIDVAYTPDRLWLAGRVEMSLKVRANAVSNIALRLADSLVVRSVVSPEYGRLFSMRLKNQGALLVNLPATILRDTELTLTVIYSGRVEPQAVDAETIAFQAGSSIDQSPALVTEASFLYSGEVDWYPKVSGNDYATARMRITVPAAFDCVASGEPDPSSPTDALPADPAAPGKTFLFNAPQPIRYLAFVVSRFVPSGSVVIAFSPSTVPVLERPDGKSYRQMNVTVEANPRTVGRAREIGEHAVDIARFYQSLVDDGPYPSFTVAVVESDRPGGHSPGYFAALNEPLPTAIYGWKNDPAAFESYPDFFLAHELAHQWWGQAVGWRTYHDQWISEAFSQYFAALYARRQHGDEAFSNVMRQMRRWAASESSQGPISLGYRLGHIRGDSRIYRALVYNKGAVVLHMLRELVGDDAFLQGLRRFYSASRFKSVDTAAFKASMEASTGRSLDRFFDRWILGSTLPRVKFDYQVEGSAVLLHVEQVGEIFDMPIAVTLRFANRTTSTVYIPVVDRTADLRVVLQQPVKSAEINPNDGALVEIVKN